MYLPRILDTHLDRLLPHASAIAVDGPKGVGKTETAARRAQVQFALDDESQRAVLSSDIHFRRAPSGTLLIDEWQRLPAVWDSVRRAVDNGVPPGRFLLTGSATPHADTLPHSGAGRIMSVRMRPMALCERGVTTPTVSLSALLRGDEAEIAGTTDWVGSNYFDEIVSSGFPGIRSAHESIREELLEAYLARVIDRDLPDHGVKVRRPETLRRWLASYAAASSSVTSYSKILNGTTAGDGQTPAKTTTIAYRDHLSSLWLLDPTPGWSTSLSRYGNLLQAPKHQLADPALSARLLRLSNRTLNSRRGAYMAGPLFESLTWLTLAVVASHHRAKLYHLRQHGGGREVDYILEGRDGQIVGVEVKLASNVDSHDVRHLLWLRDMYPDDVIDLVVVTAGPHAYRRPDGIAVVPLALLGE